MSGNGPRTRSGLEALQLSRHLDQCTVPELSEFLRFWGPHEKRRNGRAELVDKLQRLMADENVVYAKVDLLSERVRAVLLGLLRKTHYTSDLQGLFRGATGLEMEHYEAEAALNALAKRGFVRVSRGHEWLQYGRCAYSIPLETALVMRGLAGADSRPLERIFVHGSYQPSSVEAAANEQAAELPESISQAIAELPHEDLREIATMVVERFGGIITRHEFGTVFLERGIRWNSARFLREFGRRGLGTVGHIDLLVKGIGVEDDALILFQEAVERYVTEWRSLKPGHDHVLCTHGDLLSDVSTTLGLLKEFPVRVAKDGAVYKAARARIAEELQFPVQPLLERDEVAERVLTLVRRLGLAHVGEGGQLAVTDKGKHWLRRPLLEKVEEAYRQVLPGEVRTLRSRHLERLQDIIVAILTGEEGAGWWPGSSLAMVARNRYLLELATEDVPSNHAPLALRHHALTELGHAAFDLVARDLFCFGLVDVALHEEQPAGVRLSRLGRRLLGGAEAEGHGAKPLVVNPDFELLVMPEGDIDDLLHRLDRFSVRVRTGEVVHCKLDRRRIERATVQGVDHDEILELLETHARNEVPQNVAYSVQSWAGDVRSATLARGLLFSTNDPGVVEAILNHKNLRECVEKVVDPTTVFFNSRVKKRQIAMELRALGVYVR